MLQFAGTSDPFGDETVFVTYSRTVLNLLRFVERRLSYLLRQFLHEGAVSPSAHLISQHR